MIQPSTLEAYSAWRQPGVDQTVLCHAPFVNLNFAQSGAVTACCYNRGTVLGTYPENSVREIWTGARAQAMRKAFLKGEHVSGCDLCFHQLDSGNFAGTQMHGFDYLSAQRGYRARADMASPLILEFEIANTCNLECVMCGGFWSSSIRAHREHLPPMRSPYDKEFVRQLEEFLPSAITARFLGGEPFLIRRYYDIWESIARLNPEMRLSITTNASFLPDRARAVLERLRVDVVVSCDAVTRETYEKIRVNADFDVMMEHVMYLLDYTRRKGTSLSIAVCPMTHNWRELDQVVAFCEQHGATLHFNTVTRPPDAALASLSPDDLGDAIARLTNASRAIQSGRNAGRNARALHGLVRHLESWRDAKVTFVRDSEQLVREGREFVASLDRAVRTLLVAENGAGGDAAAELDLQQLQPIVDAMIRSHCVEGGASRSDYAEIGDVIARTALPTTDVLDRTARELVRAAQLFVRFLEWKDSGGSRHSLAFILDEHAAIVREPGDAGNTIVDHARLGELGDAIRDALQTGRIGNAGSRTTQWLNPVSLGSARFRLSEQTAALRARGVSDAALARVRTYLSVLFAEDFSFPAAFLDEQRRDGTRRPSAAIGDVNDARWALESLYVYHCCITRVEDEPAFRRRTEVCLEFLDRSDRATSLAAAFDSAGLRGAYGFLVHASDDELAAALSSVP